MRYTALALILIACFAFAQRPVRPGAEYPAGHRAIADAKGPCTEELIRDGIHMQVRTDDFYIFNPMMEKPVIGSEKRQEARQAMAAQMANRKNVKTEAKLDRVVVAPSGDMAYGYGTTHISYDEGDSGKHVDATVAFLSVWRADGDSCLQAASMARLEGQQ